MEDPQQGRLHKAGKILKLNFSGAIFINFMEKISKFFFSGSESHGSHDLTKIISGKELYLLCVKQVKTNLQALNLISGKISQVIDLLKVNICVRITAHDYSSGVLFLLTTN